MLEFLEKKPNDSPALQMLYHLYIAPKSRQASVAVQWLPAGAIGKKKKNARALYLDLTPATKVILSHICNGILWPTLSGTSLCYGRFGTCLTSGPRAQAV